MTATRFRIVTADGVERSGYVQGCGGLIGAGNARPHPEADLRRLRGEVLRAGAGRLLGIPEPRAGHCAVYARSDRDAVLVDLRGAIVELDH